MQVSLGHPLGYTGQLAHRSRRAFGDEHRQEHGQRRHEQHRWQDGLAQVGHVGFDLAQREGNAHDARHLPLRRHRDNHVHHLVAHRPAEANAVALPSGQRLLHLRPVQVVVHLGSVLV